MNTNSTTCKYVRAAWRVLSAAMLVILRHAHNIHPRQRFRHLVGGLRSRRIAIRMVNSRMLGKPASRQIRTGPARRMRGCTARRLASKPTTRTIVLARCSARRWLVPPASQNPRLRFWHWFSMMPPATAGNPATTPPFMCDGPTESKRPSRRTITE